MMTCSLFPENDAAPLAGGAGVNRSGTHNDDSHARNVLSPTVVQNSRATSYQASDRIAKRAPSQRVRVHTFSRKYGRRGATDDEGEAELRTKTQSYTPRRRELVRLGLMKGSERRRSSASGSRTVVWIAANYWHGEVPP